MQRAADCAFEKPLFEVFHESFSSKQELVYPFLPVFTVEVSILKPKLFVSDEQYH